MAQEAKAQRETGDVQYLSRNELNADSRWKYVLRCDLWWFSRTRISPFELELQLHLNFTSEAGTSSWLCTQRTALHGLSQNLTWILLKGLGFIQIMLWAASEGRLRLNELQNNLLKIFTFFFLPHNHLSFLWHFLFHFKYLNTVYELNEWDWIFK